MSQVDTYPQVSSTATLSECAVSNVDPPLLDSTEAKIDSTSKKTEPKTEFVPTSSTFQSISQNLNQLT